MKRCRTIIQQNITKHTHFDEYFKLLDIIEEHEINNPDICIETCKALIEGISKTILVNIDDSRNKETIDKDDLPKLFSTVSSLLPQKCPDIEGDFVNRFGQIIKTIGEIRNRRSDISHGRMAPKFIYSSAKFASTVVNMTDSMLEYILEHYFAIPLESNSILEYEKLSEYNDWLDDSTDFPIKTVRYSKLLFENDREEYEQRFSDEYVPFLEKPKEIDQILEDLSVEKYQDSELEEFSNFEGETVSESSVSITEESLIEYESKFEDKKAQSLLKKFSKKWNIDMEKLEEKYEEYYFSEKEPMRDELVNLMKQKPTVTERKNIGEELKREFLEMADLLNILRTK